FPTQLRRHCSSLLEKAACKASDLDVWTAVANILIDFSYSAIPTTLRAVTIHTEDDGIYVEGKDRLLRTLHDLWNTEYVPDSLDALRDEIKRNEKEMDQFYAKTLIFVQSSGMGKSRLADAFGETCPMINFVLRDKGTTGYPPTDSEVLSFTRMALSGED